MNIADVKKELSGDEKVLESAFKLETLYKKYKFIIWALVIGLVLFFVGRTVLESIQKEKLSEANEAFLALQATPDDAQELTILKEKNPALYELFTFSQASKNKDLKVLTSLSKSSNDVVSDISAYTVAGLEGKPATSKMYNDMAVLENAYLDIKAGNIKGANTTLNTIAQDSPLSMLALLLKHSTLKAQ